MTQCGADTTATADLLDPTDLSAWNTVMTQLRAWYEDPIQLIDGDITPPTLHIIDKAYRLALAMRDNRSPGPLRVVPDGEGGIVFERQEGDVFETIGIDADGKVEFMSFEGSHLTARAVLAGADENERLRDDSERQNSTLLSESARAEPTS